MTRPGEVLALFTGIVEEVGRVRDVLRQENGVVLCIAARRVLDDLHPGSSIAVSGACQTVLDLDAGSFRVAAEQETLRVTTLGELRPGSAVNLERSLAAGGRLDGHFVLGHVDGTARVVAVRQDGRTWVLELEIPEDLRPYVVPKGCLAVDGVSLTVGPRVHAGRFELFLIPYTWEHTGFSALRAGARVNVETDVVGRYVVHLLRGGGEAVPGTQGASGFSREALERAFGKTGGEPR